jgi:Glycosyltransferase family 87
MNGPTWRGMAAAGIVAFGTFIVATILVLGVSGTNPGGRDFIEYWAAEQQLVHGANPYDAKAMLGIERAEGFGQDRAELWYSPPAVLFLALPLGFVSAKTGLVLWQITLFILLSASIWGIWLLNGRPANLLHVCGYLFAPALVCFQAGQISIFFLFGVVLFLLLHKERPLLAGAALLPCALKPHLFLPFAVGVILWMISRRAYRIGAGFLAMLIAGAVVAFYFDPGAWSQYSEMMRSERLLNEFAPTLGEAFRYLIHRDAGWLQFVPEVAGCVWAAWYFWTRRERWDWMDQGMLLLLASVMCRPYGWFFDETVLLPAVMTGVFRAKESGRSLIPIAVVAAAALVEMSQLTRIASPLYLWTAPAWLGCYLYATVKTQTAGVESARVGAQL